MRYSILDGFRGFFLLFMGVAHLNGPLQVLIGKLNHHYLGWVEDAQGFVFISGMVVGLVYGGQLVRKSFADMRRAVYRRCRTIYAHQAGLILIFLASMVVLRLNGWVPWVLEPYAAEPVWFTLSSLGLVSASLHMGILPMYIWFMLVTPAVLRAFRKGHAVSVLLISVLCWMFAQTGLVDVITALAERWAAERGLTIEFGIFFNVFGWQVLFFSGLFIGFRLAEGRVDLSFLKAPAFTSVFYIGLIGVLGFAIYDRIVFDDWISPSYSAAVLSMVDRRDFSAIYVINFYLDLFLITWLLVAGRNCGKRWIGWTADTLRWIFTRPALVFLGQHSLHVFSYHILLVYVLEIAVEGRQIGELWGSVILIAGVLSLYLPAWAHSLVQARDKKSRPVTIRDAKLRRQGQTAYPGDGIR